MQPAQPLPARQGGLRRAGSPARGGPGPPSSMSFGLATFWRKTSGCSRARITHSHCYSMICNGWWSNARVLS